MVVDPEAVYRIAQARTHLRRLEGSANLDVDALDRIVVFGEIGYAIVHRVALPVLCERLARRRGAGRTVRDVETWFRVRDTAWETYVEVDGPV